MQLSETAFALNGVVIADRTNPSQDPRISIRGVGARSSFGVRGIRILRDGMPLTLPDGQTPVDYLDLEAIGRVEAMRGAASSLYGNASGGVIDFRSAPPPESPVAAQIRASWAGYNSARYTGVARRQLRRRRLRGELRLHEQRWLPRSTRTCRRPMATRTRRSPPASGTSASR